MESNKSYTVTCLALNSRPSVQLKIYDQNTNTEIGNLSFLSVSKTLKTESCDEKRFCNSSLTNIILFSKSNINNNNIRLACKAENNTNPFIISRETAFSANIIDMR